MRIFLGLAALALAGVAAFTMSGRASSVAGLSSEVRVIDGDTFEMGEHRYRLLNMDAPEIGQTCRKSNGTEWRCGEAAANALRAMVSGASVTCTVDGTDVYGRRLAHCSAGDIDMGGALVSQGLAVAFLRYGDEYLDAEVAAMEARRGMWEGSFTRPAEFRSAKWSAGDQAAPDKDCPIKGNINAEGERIYHTPYSRHYGRTRVTTAKGERWFCSESEALAAGWRAPYF